jgi:hypothetical protein
LRRGAELVAVFLDEVVIPEAVWSLLGQAREDLARLYERGTDLLDLQPLPDAEESLVELLSKGATSDSTADLSAWGTHFL